MGFCLGCDIWIRMAARLPALDQGPAATTIPNHDSLSSTGVQFIQVIRFMQVASLIQKAQMDFSCVDFF